MNSEEKKLLNEEYKIFDWKILITEFLVFVVVIYCQTRSY
jgi:hypothetical protein